MTRHLLFLFASGIMSISAAMATLQVPLFSPRELSFTSPRLEKVLTSTGLLALSLPSGGDVGRTSALGGFCQCASSPDFSQIEGTDEILLFDGLTIRKSLATATLGNSPLPLGEDLARICGPKTAEAMEELRDKVAEVAKLFLESFDNLLGNSGMPILQNSYGGTYRSVSSIVQAASNLEHFHVYSKPRSTDTDSKPALRLHTDAGLFLAFVPALACEGNHDESFFLEDDQGNLHQAIFPPNSVAIMLGAGSEHWLQTALQLKATRHSVHLEHGTSRAWYGMMHLVPESAIVDKSPQRRTFGAMRQAMVLKSHSKTSRRFGDDPLSESRRDVSIGCGFSDVDQSEDDVLSAVRTRRRRLQHVENASACNNSTNFYCWMSCLDIPSRDRAQAFLKEGYSLYCVDPSILASSGSISAAQEPCTERSVVGSAMNTNCMGMWQPSAPGVVGQEVTLDSDLLKDFDEPFCYGGTSMYMDGFHWLGSTCPIYLFPSIVLDSAWALGGACFFTFFLGIVLEWVIQQRRVTVRKFPPGYKRLAASASFYCIQLTMGYTIMLVVMVYSIPLFLSVVCGIVSGHVLFSASDALLKTKSAAPIPGCDTMNEKWSDDPEDMEGPEQSETASGNNVSSLVTAAYSRRGKKEITSIPSAELDVPEGSTPCCQNEL